ncbi:MAG: amphi-Trp domain-containing protein [Gammaproteobacteria bacterium]|nr:amphi-Trp domain-containing protein [Gammaproteobacteria bacterium]
MRLDKNTFRHDSLQDTKSISKVLDSITEGLAKGKLVFSDEDDKIILNPDGLLELKVTASQEDNRQKVNVRISWQVESKTKNNKKSLTVSS